MFSFFAGHPGQAAVMVAAIVPGILLAGLLGWPLTYWWQIMLVYLALFGPAWVTCKIYAHFRG